MWREQPSVLLLDYYDVIPPPATFVNGRMCLSACNLRGRYSTECSAIRAHKDRSPALTEAITPLDPRLQTASTTTPTAVAILAWHDQVAHAPRGLGLHIYQYMSCHIIIHAAVSADRTW